MSIFSTPFLHVFLLPFLLVSVVIIDTFRRKKRNPQYAPGPPPKPLIGNLLDLPSKGSAQVFIDWGKKYNSDILFASALGNHILVMNKREDAEALFERRSKIYSDRQVVPLIGMMGWDHNIGLAQYGDKWRIHRKICQQNFNQRASNDYNPLIKVKVRELLKNLLSSPDRFDEHGKTFSTSIPLSAMYGYEASSVNDKWVELADKSLLLGAGLLMPRGSLINVLPFLRHIPSWVPGASSRKTADEVKRLTNWLIQSPFDLVKKQMATGSYTPSLVSNFLEGNIDKAPTPEEETIVSDIAFSIYVGGSDTTKSLGRSFMYLMATHPEIQKKAQAEIDRITGGTRLPDFEDRPSMPYLEAMYRELMRWMPPLHIGLPHYSTEDDEYKGYFIPKGTTVIGNIWAMTHDDEHYPEPNSFKPERFFDKDGKLNDDDHVLAYGFGRRICVGRYFATSIVWLMITSVLASFDIKKPKDEFGNEVEISNDFVDYGPLTHKLPFECSITPRSMISQELILEA